MFKKDSDIEYLLGSKQPSTLPTKPFDSLVCEFLEIFSKTTGLTCSLLCHRCAEVAEEGSPVRGRMLYDSNAWKASLKELYESKMDVPLMDWIKDRYGEADLFSDETLNILPLIPQCMNAEGDGVKIPQLVVKWI